MPLSYSKSEFADRLHVTKSRISQLLGEGLPAREDGRIDAMAGCGWVLENLADVKAHPTRQNARMVMAQAHSWNVVQAVVAEVPASVALAASLAGLRRDQVEKLANLTTLMVAGVLDEQLGATGLPELDLPHPDAWPKQVNWPGLFDEDGAPLPATGS